MSNSKLKEILTRILRILHIIFYETLAKLYKKESTQEREREKETRGKNQSLSKPTAQKRWGHKVVREPLHTETFTSGLKHIN
jgi:hypothetical protein